MCGWIGRAKEISAPDSRSRDSDAPAALEGGTAVRAARMTPGAGGHTRRRPFPKTEAHPIVQHRNGAGQRSRALWKAPASVR